MAEDDDFILLFAGTVAIVVAVVISSLVALAIAI